MKKYLLALLLLIPSSALAQYAVWSEPVINQFGQPIAGATVAVCNLPQPTNVTPCGGTTLASIGTDFTGATPQINPLFTDINGRAFVFAAPGNYYIQIYGFGLITTVVPISIGGSGGGGGGSVVSVFGRAGVVAAVNTDYGSTGIAQVGSGTLGFTCNSTGTCSFGNGSNFLEMFPTANSLAWLLTDKYNDTLGASGIAGGSALTIASNISAATLVLNGGSSPNTILAFNSAPEATFSPTGDTFAHVVNFAGVGGFQIGGSFGTVGQVPCSTGSAIVMSSTCGAVSGVTSVGGTANQIVNTGSASNAIFALFGAGTSSPLIFPGNLSGTQRANGDTLFLHKRNTDVSPTGIFDNYLSAAGAVLAQLDIFGNHQAQSYTTLQSGAGYEAYAAGTDNGATCLAALTALSLTGSCDEAPSSITTSWTNIRPNAAPSVFSVLTSAAVSGSEAAQHYVATTNPTAPGFIQTAATSATTATAGNLASFDANHNTQDSGIAAASLLTNGTCASGTVTVPLNCGTVNSTGLVASLGNTNILTTSPNGTTAGVGQYRLSVYLNATTACTGSPSGNIFVAKIAYTDSQGATTKTAVGMGVATTVPSNTTAVITFWNNGSTSTMNVSGTYSTCTTLGGAGTETIDAHYTLERIQ